MEGHIKGVKATFAAAAGLLSGSAATGKAGNWTSSQARADGITDGSRSKTLAIRQEVMA